MGMDYSNYGVPRLDIGEALQEYIDSATNYIGTQVLPLTPVGVESGKYSAIVRETITARAKTNRGDTGRYNRVGLKAEDVLYACDEHGLEYPVSEKVRNRYMNDFDAEMAGAKKIASQLMREQEIRIADQVFDPTVWTGSSLFLDTTTVWSDSAADIIADIETAKTNIFANTGMEANALVLNRNVARYLRTNANIVDAVKYTKTATNNNILSEMADIFGLEKILVGRGVKNTKPEGDTAFAGTPVWSDSYAMVAYIPESDSVEVPAVGRTFLWTGDSPTNMVSESYEENQTRSNIIRIRQNVDEKIIDPYFGFLLKVD